MEINNMINGSVSLRFWHPTQNLTFLSLLLEMPCYRNWTSGASRETPKGKPLPGIYKDSYWVSRLEFSSKEGFKKQFVLAMDHLIKVKQKILKFNASGGKIEVYLQLPGNVNHGGTIDSKYSSMLSELDIDLLIEVFP